MSTSFSAAAGRSDLYRSSSTFSSKASDLFSLTHFYLSSSCWSQTSFMYPLLNWGHPFLPPRFIPSPLFYFFVHLLTCSKRIPLIHGTILCLAVQFLVGSRSQPYASPPCADEEHREDRYLNTGCSVEHGKLYQIWIVQTNLFTVPRNLSALRGFPLGSPRPDLRLSARTNAGLGWGGAPRELSCHRLLPWPAFTWT